MGVNTPNRAKLTTTRITKLITSAHTQLQGVHTECLHWDVFIKRYDRPFTLFYIDPPYWGHENDYGKGLFRRDDFVQMAKQLKSIKGTFILSINDIPDIRTLFKDFTIESITTRYTVNSKATRRANALLISNHAI